MITLLSLDPNVFGFRIFLLAEQLGQCFNNRLFLLEWFLYAKVVLLVSADF